MNEDPTQNIEQKYDTNPTLETIMESINMLAVEMRAGFARIEQQFGETGKRLDSLQSELTETREEMRTGFRKFGHKIDALNQDLLDLKADMRDLVSRMDAAEVKQ
jgi:DNA anti-recombination protein RmuC